MSTASESSIEIAAPADEIMAALVDVESYPSWLSAVTSATVRSWSGRRPEDVTIVLDGGGVHDECELRFGWPDELTGQFTLVSAQLFSALDARYDLEPLGDDTTTVFYRLALELRQAPQSLSLPVELERRAADVIIAAAMTGLKRRVEG